MDTACSPSLPSKQSVATSAFNSSSPDSGKSDRTTSPPPTAAGHETSTTSSPTDPPDLRTGREIEEYFRELEVHGLFYPSSCSSNMLMDDDVLQLASLFTISEILEHLNRTPGGKTLGAKAVHARIRLAAERIARRRGVEVEAVLKGLEKARRESGVVARGRAQAKAGRELVSEGAGVLFPGLGGRGNRGYRAASLGDGAGAATNVEEDEVGEAAEASSPESRRSPCSTLPSPDAELPML